MTAAPPPWINCDDAPVHCSYGSVSCAYVRFDRQYEALWTVDTSGLVSSFTISPNAAPGRAEWSAYSRFRAVKGPIGIGFSGNRARPLTVVMSNNSLHVHKAGGVGIFSSVVDQYSQRKVQSFLSLEKAAIFTGETPSIGVTRFDDDNYSSGSGGEGGVLDGKGTKYYTLDASAMSGVASSISLNLQMCLPKTLNESNQKWIPIGIANGSVVVCDMHNDFKTIGTTGRIFQTRVNAVRCIDNTIVAVNSLGNTTTVKIFDVRMITETAMTINSIEGTLVDLDMFRNPYTSELELLMVTPQMFYVLSPTESTPIYRSFQIDNQSITSCSATVNGKGSVIALNSGHFLTMRRVNPFSTPTSPTAPTKFTNCADETFEGILPPRPIAKSKWHINKNDLAAGFDHKAAAEMYNGEVVSSNEEPSAAATMANSRTNTSSPLSSEPSALMPFSRNKKPALFSAWPPDNYMILKVSEKHKAPAAFIRQVMESKDMTIPQDCQRLTDGRVYAFPNTVALQRSDLYRPDPKDKIARIIPNPYPYNCDVGDDPTQVATIAIPKLKELRAKRTGKDSRYFCSEAEEALQVCYPLQGTFDWKNSNALPKDIVGIDNTLPESWISPIVQCMYLVHGPQFPIRHAITRHFCPRQNCVACELNIVFSNMVVTSSAELTPIVQLGSLLGVLRRRREFSESKIFVPARNRDEMVGKLHLAQSLMLQCLDVDFSSVAPSVGPTAAGLCSPPTSNISSPNTQRSPAANGSPTYSNLNNNNNNNSKSSTNANNAAASAIGSGVTQFPDLPEPPEMARIIKEYFGTQLEAHSPIDPILYWEMPPSAAKVEEGLTHVLKQVEFSRPRERIHIRALPPVLVILLNPDHGHLQPPPTLTFTRDKEEYSYSLCCQVHHLSDDVDDKGLFVSTHTWPKASARPDIAQTTTNGVRSDTVLINDYFVSAPMTNKQFETCIPPSVSHSVALGYYSYDKFTQKSFSYPRGGNNPPAPAQLSYKDSRRHLLNTWSFLGPLMVHDIISESIPQPFASKYPPQRFIKSLDEVQPTDLVAIDAEYVIPNWGNLEHSFQRKPYYLLARVSCLVSSGPGDERVLIDDYLETEEEIKDYVSQYSGIHHGDLSAAQSHYPLTTRKANNMKLRALVDRGCKFVGHGLSQDFRVCNIQVPPSQTIDTLELYAKTKAAGGRKFALRLLAATLLGESIQEDEHDSVEDARTALRLYRRYCELHASGQLEAFVDTVVMGGSVDADTPPRGTSPATLTTHRVTAEPSTTSPRPTTPPVLNANATAFPLPHSKVAGAVTPTGATVISSAAPLNTASAFGASAVVTTTTPPAGTSPSSSLVMSAATNTNNTRSAFANITPPTLVGKAISPSSFPSAPTSTAVAAAAVTPVVGTSALATSTATISNNINNNTSCAATGATSVSGFGSSVTNTKATTTTAPQPSPAATVSAPPTAPVSLAAIVSASVTANAANNTNSGRTSSKERDAVVAVATATSSNQTATVTPQKKRLVVESSSATSTVSVPTAASPVPTGVVGANPSTMFPSKPSPQPTAPSGL